MFLSIQEIIPDLKKQKKTITIIFFSISYNNAIYHDINLPLLGKEMLSHMFVRP